MRTALAFYLSAAHKSSGKTTIGLGLGRALTRRGLEVQPFKKGPDYIDPIWHSRACHKPCYNLDFHMMQCDEIDHLYARHAAQSAVVLVEGNKGLYDGMDVAGSDSNAALAKRLGLPVVLVIDASGITRGVAPLVLGYKAFDHEVKIAGVILNKVAGPRHEQKLRAVLDRYTQVPVLGAVPRDAALFIAERHLGLIPGNEHAEADARIDAIANVVARHVDLDALLQLTVKAVSEAVEPLPFRPRLDLTIGIARDRAFGFYYQEDIDNLRAAGVRLVEIDCLHDARLPPLDGLILGGGFPESFLRELSANVALREGIRTAIAAGLPVYAECGGLMYLTRGIVWQDVDAAMVGAIPGVARMSERPVGRGYALLRGNGASPLAPAGMEIPAHEFHYSALTGLPDDWSAAYAVVRGHGIAAQRDGFVVGNLLASYCHRRGSGDRGWIAPFLAQVAAYKERKEN